MEEHKLVGNAFDTFSRAVYVNSRGGSDIGELSCWFQSFTFKNDGIILNQKHPGPCGVFAVLEAFIVKDFFDPDLNLTRDELLIKSLLDVMQIINPKFALCCDIDTSSYAIFKVTGSRDTMHDYLTRTNFIHNEMALYLFTLGIIYASMGLDDLKVPISSYIYADQFTTMYLVFLMLIGTSDEAAIQALEEAPQLYIGMRVVKYPDQRVVKAYINPGVSFVVCLNMNHFYAAMVNGDEITIFDTLGGDTPRVSPKPSTWT